ncbi:MAG: DEAD/DEAH box helicase [Spirochaetes bacterium]|jgi:ATP-dependent DNA helicase RecQ|nr:DEAD/DEAH box helicase [Spirochaetota bacterium]
MNAEHATGEAGATPGRLSTATHSGDRPGAKAADTSDPLGTVARERFGVDYLFPYQRLVMTNVLQTAAATATGSVAGAPAGAHRSDAMPRDEVAAAEDLWDRRHRQLVILPTGSGKSLCFQLPAVLLPGVTVVVYPLLALIADQKRRLDELGVPCETLTGGSSAGDVSRIRAALRPSRAGNSGGGAATHAPGVSASQRGPRLILTNPEALGTRRARRLFEGVAVSHLVIDEAHCVAEWGETFRPAYLELGAAIRTLHPHVVTGFTATASPDILARINTHLFADTGYHIIRGNPDRPNIRYAVLPVASKSAALRTLLAADRSDGCDSYDGGDRAGDSSPESGARRDNGERPRPRLRPAVVFCRTRGRCERTARELRRVLDDERIRFYHAGLSREEKTEVEEWFLGSEEGVLVATCAYGMGVDAPGIRSVIHRDLPPTVESYLQESGRAGRDGEPAQAIVLAGPSEMTAVAGTTGTRWGALLSGERCRRAVLVEALGAHLEACPGCDVCDGVARRESPVAEAIVSWLSRRRRRYTPGQAAAVLAGTARTAPVPWHPAREPVFGLLRSWRREEIEEALEELKAAGRLWVIRRGPWWGRISL